MAGSRFGRYIVIERHGQDKGRSATWLCRCDCGTAKVVGGYSLRSGRTVSCGCYGKERVAAAMARRMTHGATDTPAYKSWGSMIQRCTNPNNPKFNRYGGRGITVCRRWLKFENFFADMGQRKRGHTLERKNVNGNYEPGNCVWIPAVDQAVNRTNNRSVTMNGKTRVLAEWCRELNLSYVAVRMRLHRGWTEIEALTTPLR
jgi:hypothetical protein